jgi:ferric uptake regulation protein
VFEFTDNIIEQRQKEISEQHGIKLKAHSLYLYGKCSDINKCEEKK